MLLNLGISYNLSFYGLVLKLTKAPIFKFKITNETNIKKMHKPNQSTCKKTIIKQLIEFSKEFF
jgi:hypothetical protein